MAEITEQELLNMKPHEDLLVGNLLRMIRVVGGWIYWKTEESVGESEASIAVAGVFVPESPK